MKRILCAVGLGALSLTWAPSPAHAVTGALCIKSTLNGSLKMRATGTCKATEIQIGSFDGTTLQLSGINLQIVSGAGTTDGAVNGLGNLIVGYNANTGAHDRTGSHNLVVGDEHGYASYGGLLAGLQNTVSAPWASVSGGQGNTASGFRSSVSGGLQNVASGDLASVSGGQCNVAGAGPVPGCGGVGGASWVGGGFGNLASGPLSSVSGGDNNTASGVDSSVGGGEVNSATGTASAVTGGRSNSAQSSYASVSGGTNGTEVWSTGV